MGTAAGTPVEVGIVLREHDLGAWSGRLHELAERSVAAGVDHLTVGDHVSFADGEIDLRGRFFEIHGAIRPAPAKPLPVLVGGRSDAALARTGQLGDGWLGLWVSPRRFAAGDRPH